MSKNKSRVCLCCTSYSLFEYLVYSSYDEIMDTIFVFEGWMFPLFENKFNNSYYLRHPYGRLNNKYLSWLWWWYIKYFKIPSFRNKKLFALDHLPHQSILIGKHNYTLLEDAPYVITRHLQGEGVYSRKQEGKRENSPFSKLAKLLYGPVFFNRFGKSSICKELLLSTDEYYDFFDSKNVIRVDYNNKFSSFPPKKQQLFLDVYGMKDSDLILYKSRDIVLFTDPLFPDFIDKNEHIDIYKKIIARYPKDQILIKPHPRDNINYEELFPGVLTAKATIPSQFLNLLGLKLNKCVTIISSAIFQINCKEIDLYNIQNFPVLNEKIKDKLFIPSNMLVNYCNIDA